MELKEMLITIGVSSTIVGFAVKTWMKQSMVHYYNTKLASFNEQIAINSEYRKMHLDKKIHDSSLYSSKRHEVYSQLYKRLYKLNVDFSRVGKISSFGDLNEISSILKYVEEISFCPLSEEKIDIINRMSEASNHNLNKEDLESISDLIRGDLLNNLGPRMAKFIEFTEENTLYISDEAIEKVTITINIMSDLYGYMISSETDITNGFELLEENLVALKEFFKVELSSDI